MRTAIVLGRSVVIAAAVIASFICYPSGTKKSPRLRAWNFAGQPFTNQYRRMPLDFLGIPKSTIAGNRTIKRKMNPAVTGARLPGIKLAARKPAPKSPYPAPLG
jgi:hypothetical protein